MTDLTTGPPPVRDGYIRVYEDHTGRWYKDYPREEYEREFNSPEMQRLRQAIRDEIDAEIIARLKEIQQGL